MKFVMKVRKRTISEYPFEQKMEEILGGFPILKLPEDYGVITACNKTHFVGLQMLIYSIKIRFEVPIFIFDVGMTEEQISYLNDIPNIKVEKFVPVEELKNLHYWEAWAKPFYTKNSPFEKTIWIDADAVVTGDLFELIIRSKEKPLFTCDHSGVADGTLNGINLYNELPIDGIEKDSPPYINTGVYVVESSRDKKLLSTWCYCVNKAIKNQIISSNVTCWDQGACKWALQKLNMIDTIVSDVELNYPALLRQRVLPASPSGIKTIMHGLKYAVMNNILIYHWMGNPKPWVNWNMLNFKNSKST